MTAGTGRAQQPPSLKVEGRVWLFGDHINTDLMYPGAAYKLPPAERPTMVFSANRPGWSDLVEPGDIIVAGRNFGTGSGRPAGQLMRALGIAGIVAEGVNGLFFRNSLNCALPIMECPGVCEIVQEGQRISTDFSTGLVTNLDTGQQARGAPLPTFLVELVAAGGIIERLVADGYLHESV